MRRSIRALVAVLVVVVAGKAALAASPSASPPASSASTGASAGRIERLAGIWVEGPGFDVTYGGTYDGCAKRCLANGACVMIEYYRPEKKCNLYDRMRPRRSGGSSDVGIRR